MIKRIIFFFIIASCASCASSAKVRREPTRQEIEQDFQKAYNKAQRKKNDKKINRVALVFGVAGYLILSSIFPKEL